MIYKQNLKKNAQLHKACSFAFGEGTESERLSFKKRWLQYAIMKKVIMVIPIFFSVNSVFGDIYYFEKGQNNHDVTCFIENIRYTVNSTWNQPERRESTSEGEPTQKKRVVEKTETFECECYEIFYSLLNYGLDRNRIQNPIESPKGVFTYILKNISEEEHNFISQHVVIDLSNNTLTLFRDDKGDLGNYTKNYHFIYKCSASNLPGLNDFNTAYKNAYGQYIGEDNRDPRVLTWPRSIDFHKSGNGFDNGNWIYKEESPLERYVYYGSKRNDMLECQYFETNRLAPINGWKGKNGENNTELRNPFFKRFEPAPVNDEDLSPAMFDAIKNSEPINPTMGLMPNPADKVLKLKYVDIPKGGYMLEITDVQGKKVFTKLINITGKEGIYDIPTSKLKSGTYMLHLSNNKLSLDQSFIIKR